MNKLTPITNNLQLSKFVLQCMMIALVLVGKFAHAENTAGELVLLNPNGQQFNALVLDTRISGEINGLIANIVVDQSFENGGADWVNGRYVFPLPEDAAVDSLRIEIGERTIEGVMKEKELAKKVYQQAKKAGKKAGLLEQHRPNIFSISIANIAPGELVNTRISFVSRVTFDNNQFSLRLPTTLTPRYIAGTLLKKNVKQEELLDYAHPAPASSEQQTDIDIDPHSGWALDTDRVPDASKITPPQKYPSGDRQTHQFSLNLNLNAGLDLEIVNSESHSLTTNFIGSANVEIGLSNVREPMNSDLILNWQATIGSSPAAALFQQQHDGSHYSMLMLAPPKVNQVVALPRDITFIIDSSGSMAGGSMQQAKQALINGLEYLSVGDRFNVIDFDSSFRPLFNQSQAVSDQALENARKMITSLSADGGTEMLGALRFALHNGGDENEYLKQIVFITDGAIGDENQLFKLIQEKLSDSRLFTVGIGSSPNSFFMSKAAKFGRGSYTYVSDLKQVNEKMAGLFEKITKPVLRDLRVEWSSKVEQYPARIPDLYAGQPLLVLVKSDKPVRKLSVSGNMLDSVWHRNIKLAKTQAKNADKLATVWARDKIGDLMDKHATGEMALEQVKPKVTELGIKHNIVTKYTSFVAVDKTPSKPEFLDAKHGNVPNLMPKGSTMAVPQTASAAGLLSLLGSMLLLIAAGLGRYQNSKAPFRGNTKKDRHCE